MEISGTKRGHLKALMETKYVQQAPEFNNPLHCIFTNDILEGLFWVINNCLNILDPNRAYEMMVRGKIQLVKEELKCL